MAFINIAGLDLSGNLTVEPLVVGPEFTVMPQGKTLSTGKLFGFAMASDNVSAIVGAYNSAKAYIYGYNGTSWTVEAELTESGRFGYKVAISGNWAAVTNTPASGNGNVFVYRKTNGTWVKFAQIDTPDASLGFGFGWSVALSGTTMVIGHRQASLVGGAHVYVFNGTAWVRQGGLLTIPAASTRANTNQSFGIDVSIHNDILVVGGSGDTTGRGLGMAFVSKRSGTTWSAPQAIQPETTTADGFGWSVKVRDNLVVVGAPNGDTTSKTPGRVFLYNVGGATPVLTNTFTIKADKTELIQDTLTTANDNYGWGIDVNATGNLIAVTALNRNGNRGTTYLYEKFANKWYGSAMPNSRIDAPDATANARFGSSVVFARGGILVGAYGQNAFYWFK